MNKLILIAILLVPMLLACGEQSDVVISGGTVNTLDIKAEETVIGVMPDGAIAIKAVFGATINAGASLSPSIIYPSGDNYTFAELNALRDLTLYPYTLEELIFLEL